MYDYKCLDCGKEFLLALTLKEHETGAAACSHCGSKNLQQLYTSFIARTTKKS
jgi:putative FmdB family regulatory protein